MSGIAYDSVKNRFADSIRNTIWLRRLFYLILDLLFLRSWYMRRLLRNYGDRLEREPWMMLDAGSGFGQYDRFVLDRYLNVHIRAVDLKRDYLEDSAHYFAKTGRSERILFEQSDLLTLSEENVYDLILCIDVLEHIEEDVLVLKNLSRALKPGGILLVHSPSHLSAEDANEGEESFVDEHARSGYHPDDLTDKMKLAGLHVDRIGYSYGVAGHLAWRLSVKLPMLLLSRWNGWALLPLSFYYIPVLPLALILNRLDLIFENRKGSGVFAAAIRVGADESSLG